MAKSKNSEIGVKYLGQTAAAKHVGVSPNRFMVSYIKSGTVPFIEVGKRKIFHVDDLNRLKDELEKYHPEKIKEEKKDGRKRKVLSRRKVV